jgi:hypothetical protein
MKKSRCPVCGAQQFYVKDPDDQYNISTFSLDSGNVKYSDEEPGADQIAVLDDSEIFCEKCAWHDKFISLLRKS